MRGAKIVPRSGWGKPIDVNIREQKTVMARPTRHLSREGAAYKTLE
jgi:hypothetical protein